MNCLSNESELFSTRTNWLQVSFLIFFFSQITEEKSKEEEEEQLNGSATEGDGANGVQLRTPSKEDRKKLYVRANRETVRTPKKSLPSVLQEVSMALTLVV